MRDGAVGIGDERTSRPTAPILLLLRKSDQAYRPYIDSIRTPPRPILDDYAAHASEGAVWVLEEGAETVAIIVLLPARNYLLGWATQTVC